MGRIRINGIDLDAQTIPQVTVTASGTLPATVRGTAQSFNAAAGALTNTLPTTPSTGDYFWAVKGDASANRVTLRVGGTDVAWLSAQGDEVLWHYNGTAWMALTVNLAPLVITHLITAASNDRPPLAKYFSWINQAPGGGGGSGRRGAAATARFAGGGGSNGALSRGRVSLPSIGNPTTYAVTIAAPGVGGAAVAVDDTNGNAGTAGGVNILTFGSLNSRSQGGAAGGGGTAAAGTAGAAIVNNAQIPSNVGGAAATTGNGGSGFAAAQNMSLSGAAGGSLDAANTARQSGSLGSLSTPFFGGAAGVASGNAPAPSPATIDTGWDFSGIPSVGGGPNGGNAVKGGWGSGGSGGGASVNGTNSGAGADGGDGVIRVMFEF